MLIDIDTQLECARNRFTRKTFVVESREKVKNNKMFSLKDTLIISILIFSAGISLGITIMQIIT